uniref:Uncharacterized protein n=1 Tax=Strombidinopsis acuminata TaxID=141414 RepID=A0A7S3T0Q5_9SPIT
MRGFKDDFDAWKGSLSQEEKKMIQEQAAGEFNKKFRKSDEFKQDLPEEKIAAFSKILGKFFDAESEDYKKELEAKTPEYDGLLKKAGDKVMDFSLKSKVIEVDRDADRRYQFATMKNRQAIAKGEFFPQSSPIVERWAIKNDDAESHAKAEGIVKFMEKAMSDPSCPADAKPYMEHWVKNGIPAVGTPFEITVPMMLVNQLHHMNDYVNKGLAEMDDAAAATYLKDKVPAIGAEVIKFLSTNYASARDEVEADKDTMKAFFRSQKDMKDKTKADVLKELWAELPKHTGKPVPPLDDEMLAELAEEPAVIEGEFKHSWGTADKLYKSEAIDAFGQKYLLGVFESKAEAEKAFADWNSEYEKARSDMKAEMQQWSKQEQARLDKDTTGQERIKKVLDEARR